MSKEDKDKKYKDTPLSEEQIERLEEIARKVQKDAERVKGAIDNSGMGKIQEQVKGINERFKIPEDTYRNIKEAVTAQQEWVKTLNQFDRIGMENKIESITLPPRELTKEEFQEFKDDFDQKIEKIIRVVKESKNERRKDNQKSAKLNRIMIYIAIGTLAFAALTYFIFYV